MASHWLSKHNVTCAYVFVSKLLFSFSSVSDTWELSMLFCKLFAWEINSLFRSLSKPSLLDNESVTECSTWSIMFCSLFSKNLIAALASQFEKKTNEYLIQPTETESDLYSFLHTSCETIYDTTHTQQSQISPPFYMSQVGVYTLSPFLLHQHDLMQNFSFSTIVGSGGWCSWHCLFKIITNILWWQ